MAITVKHSKVSTIPDDTDASLVRPSDWNADHTLVGLGTMAEQNANAVVITGGTISGVTIPASNITGTLTVPNGGTGATTLTGYVKGAGTTALTASSTIPNTDVTGLGTMSTQNSNNISVTSGSMSGVTISDYIPTTQKAAALGVATLDSSTKVPISQIPDAVIGALNYQGSWNATTNTPTLTSSVGVKGYYYVVSVAGSTNLNGTSDWLVGDWAVYNGTIWQKVDNTDSVTSVNTLTGAVVLSTTNIAEGTNLYYTDTKSRAALSAGTGISYNNTTGVITNSSPSLGGDVVGPASAINNAIPRFDTTTGKLLKNSVVTVGDTGVIAGATSVTDINFVDFNTAYATALTEGQLGWNGNNTLALSMAGGNVVQHIGEDSYFYIKASAAITKGQLIMYTGAVGASGVITGAPATGVTSGQNIIGIAAETMALNAFGLVQWFGELTGLNTSAFTEGDIVYYNSAVIGGLTNIYPTTGLIVTVASVAKTSSGSGVLIVKVSVTQRITASTGISVSQTNTGSVITNTAPDQTVALTAGTGISVAGTYPNFSVTNTAPSSGGTVTSVTGTSPVVSSGGNTPAISIPKATTLIDGYLSATDWTTFNSKQPAGIYLTTVTSDAPLSGSGTPGNHLVIATANTSTTGALTSADWNTFNGKGSGTVTAVSATAPITSSGGATPNIAMPAATISVNGYLTSTDFTTFNAKQATLVSGTNIKTINGSTLLGSGNLTVNGTPAGSTTQVQYNNAGAFGASSSFTFASLTLTAPVVSASNGLVVNSASVSASYSIPSGSNAMSVGPITVASGQAVTVPSGSRWVVL